MLPEPDQEMPGPVPATKLRAPPKAFVQIETNAVQKVDGRSWKIAWCHLAIQCSFTTNVVTIKGWRLGSDRCSSESDFPTGNAMNGPWDGAKTDRRHVSHTRNRLGALGHREFCRISVGRVEIHRPGRVAGPIENRKGAAGEMPGVPLLAPWLLPNLAGPGTAPTTAEVRSFDRLSSSDRACRSMIRRTRVPVSTM